MNSQEFLKAFIEDCKYYDLENKELKEILKSVKIKNKRILDIGAGIGRLSFPLAKHAKEVVALEKDKRFSEYFNKRKNKKVKFVNQSLESYAKKSKSRKFDVILLAWPTFNSKFIGLIKKFMCEKSKFIFITCTNDSDYETIIDKIAPGGYFNKDTRNKEGFIKQLPKKFRLVKKKIINTDNIYPNKNTAFRVIKNAVTLWFGTKFDDTTDLKLKGLIKQHENNKKVTFEEKVLFYVMEKNLKCK